MVIGVYLEDQRNINPVVTIDDHSTYMFWCCPAQQMQRWTASNQLLQLSESIWALKVHKKDIGKFGESHCFPHDWLHKKMMYDMYGTCGQYRLKKNDARHDMTFKVQMGIWLFGKVPSLTLRLHSFQNPLSGTCVLSLVFFVAPSPLGPKHWAHLQLWQVVASHLGMSKGVSAQAIHRMWRGFVQQQEPWEMDPFDWHWSIQVPKWMGFWNSLEFWVILVECNMQNISKLSKSSIWHEGILKQWSLHEFEWSSGHEDLQGYVPCSWLPAWCWNSWQPPKGSYLIVIGCTQLASSTKAWHDVELEHKLLDISAWFILTTPVGSITWDPKKYDVFIWAEYVYGPSINWSLKSQNLRNEQDSNFSDHHLSKFQSLSCPGFDARFELCVMSSANFWSKK